MRPRSMSESCVDSDVTLCILFTECQTNTHCPKMVAGIKWPFPKGLIRSKLLHKVQVQAFKDLSLLSGTL